MTNLPPAENAFRDIAQHRMPQFLSGIGGHRHPSRLLAAKRLAGCETIIDVGCGPGVFWTTLAALRPGTFTYLGFDPVVEMFESAGTGVAGSLREGAAESLPLPDKSADGVLVRHVFEHLEDPAPAMREACRVCARDLVIVFSQWTNPRRSIISDSYLKALRWSHHDGYLMSAFHPLQFVARYRWGPSRNDRAGMTTELRSDRICAPDEQLGPREELWHLSRNPTDSLAALELVARVLAPDTDSPPQ